MMDHFNARVSYETEYNARGGAIRSASFMVYYSIWFLMQVLRSYICSFISKWTFIYCNVPKISTPGAEYL